MYYADKFIPDDHIRLHNVLTKIKGKFIISYNDCQVIRDLYNKFCIIEVDRFNNLTVKGGGRRYNELIIKNF